MKNEPQPYLGYIHDPAKQHHVGYPPPPADEPHYAVLIARDPQQAAHAYAETYMDTYVPGKLVVCPLAATYQFVVLPTQRFQVLEASTLVGELEDR